MREPSQIFAASGLFLGFALAAFAPAIFHDGDTWWHVAAGNWMLAHHAVPMRDIFSFTAAGQDWNAQEWLSEILMALTFRLGGWSGLHILFGLGFGATAAIVSGALARRMAAMPALITAILGLALVAGSLLARPHLLALPLLALWTAMLVKAREEKRAPPPWLALVMLAWVNLHGSFAFGLALAAALGVEAVLEDRRAAKAWAIFFALSIAAALINPRTVNGLLFPLKLLLMPAIAGIGEWAPSDVAHPTPFLLALLAMIYVLAMGKVRLAPIRALMILALIYLALAHARHQMILGVVAPLLAAGALGQAWPVREIRVPAFAARGALALAVLLAILRLGSPAVRGEDPVTPMAALAHVPDDMRNRPVLNAYDYGGYLIFKGTKVFVDGRTDLYSAGFLANYDRLAAGDDMALSRALAQYKIAWTIFPTDSQTAKALDHLPGWHRAYADANAVVHEHD